MQPIDPTRLDLAAEFRANPLGPHGAELQHLLKRLRWEPIAGRYVLVQPDRGGPWHLALTTGPKGHPLEIFPHPAFDDLAHAYWALFRKRWEQQTGEALALDERDVPLPSAGDGELTLSAARRPILGYADRFSVPGGERIAFKVSCDFEGSYRARLVRLRCGDDAALGLASTPLDSPIEREYPARHQPVRAGSYAEVSARDPFVLDAFTLAATIWPTTPGRGEQALLGNWESGDGRGYALLLDARGALALRLGSGDRTQTITTGVPLLSRHWYRVAACVDPAAGTAWLAQRPLVRYARDDTSAEAIEILEVAAAAGARLRMAAWTDGDSPGGRYNGKLEAPLVASRPLDEAEREALLAGLPVELGAATVARWDLARDIPSTRVLDVSGHGHHGDTVNLPTRAMKSSAWDGTEYNWTHRPEHYAAIHFHDDDLYDCGWEDDFTLDVPADLESGLYCAHLTGAGGEDWIPFVVRPPRGTARARLALVLPSASYWAYANRHSDVEWRERENVRGVFASIDATGLYLHEHPELGVSMYDEHSDGSGVCYSSRLRPILSLRPRELLWQLPADTHIIDWLEEKQIAFDLLTEDDVDAESDLLDGYACVMTGTHPEYPSERVLEAFARFQARGGRFVYLGGNGFYWRVSYHPQLPGVIEMRRAEDGIRSWMAEGGEYYHSFTGELGGMWRRMGRAPQSVAGTGMTAQGFDRSTWYERTPESFDPRAAFIFEGVGADERIGDFGIIGGGAAGWEIDRADPALGTPPHALVVARASGFSASYHWMKEELTHTHSAITGETCPHVHCDMVFYETPRGGAVFSTSSIAWAGALSHAGYDNNVSRITENVLRRFVDPAPL